jgi:hypothetical protein
MTRSSDPSRHKWREVEARLYKSTDCDLATTWRQARSTWSRWAGDAATVDPPPHGDHDDPRAEGEQHLWDLHPTARRGTGCAAGDYALTGDALPHLGGAEAASSLRTTPGAGSPETSTRALRLRPSRSRRWRRLKANS